MDGDAIYNGAADNAVGVAVDGSGIVYVAEADGQVIRKITPAGVVTTLAGTAGTSGSSDGTGSAARFFTPQGLTVDGSGNVTAAGGSSSLDLPTTSASNT